jgi:hypothetical protein
LRGGWAVWGGEVCVTADSLPDEVRPARPQARDSTIVRCYPAVLFG